jgi:hypothetical protein
MSLAEKTGAAGNNIKFKLQFSERPDFSQVTDVVASSTCQASSLWCYANGAGVDNAIINAKVLSDTAACAAGVGIGCGTHNEGTSSVTATFDHTAYTISEFEFTIQNAGARVNAVYYFRVWNINDNEVVLASTTYPSLLAATSSITATSTGVASGVTVDGHTSNVATTDTSVTFGEVPIDTGYVAIQRLSFATNATEGYQVFTYTDQPLTNTYGTTILPVTGTNAVPLSWAAGCPLTQDACFGYHTSDDVLLGGSARFAANDSFAALTTTPSELIYTGGPGAENHDIVYKIRVNAEQTSGDYEAAISYIITPIY